MTIRSYLDTFLANTRGSAGEFALVLPLGMLLFFGLIDAGRFAYTFNQGEKATQTGTRWAVVTDPIAPELATESYVDAVVSTGTLLQGDRIPADALDPIICTRQACVCEGTCPDGVGTPDTDAFDLLAERMREIWPEIGNENIQIEYDGSGLGYAGNPDSMDIAPFVTVRLTAMEFQSILLFGNSVGLPDFSYTLTMEDGQGTDSN